MNRRHQKEIDARPSDAVVLALNLSVDIEMADKVIEETGFTPQHNDIGLGTTLSGGEDIDELEEELRRCEEDEDYERAAEIMKKIEKLKK